MHTNKNIELHNLAEKYPDNPEIIKDIREALERITQAGQSYIDFNNAFLARQSEKIRALEKELKILKDVMRLSEAKIFEEMAGEEIYGRR